MEVVTLVFGLVGVAAGAFLSQGLSASWQRRQERHEALVAIVAASARVLGAHECLYELVVDGHPPETDSDVARQALLERMEAHAQWRTAEARALILIPGDGALVACIESFGQARASATTWVRDYQRLQSNFRLEDHREPQHKSWMAMRQARHDLIEVGQAVALADARWLPRLRPSRPLYVERG